MEWTFKDFLETLKTQKVETAGQLKEFLSKRNIKLTGKNNKIYMGELK